MTKALLLLALLAATPAAAVAPGLDGDAVSLDRDLAGYTAGAPVPCIDRRPNMRVRQYNPSTIVYDWTRRKVYRTDVGQCPELRQNRAILSRTPGPRLCEGDIIQIVDNQSGVPYGSCTLGPFTPYTRGAAAR